MKERFRPGRRFLGGQRMNDAGAVGQRRAAALYRSRICVAAKAQTAYLMRFFRHFWLKKRMDSAVRPLETISLNPPPALSWTDTRYCPARPASIP
jgi:hypothetical protein